MMSIFDLQLKGKSAIVTGASQGIGEAIAIALAGMGVNLFLIARNKKKLRDVSLQVQQYDVQVVDMVADLSDESATKKVFNDIASLCDAENGIDILINNAAQMIPKPLMFVKSEDILSHFEINTFAVLRCCQLASRLMIRSGGGSIINISSMLSEYGQSGQSVYSASKAAVDGLTRSLAQELAAHQIRVNAIAPGIIETNLISDLSQEQRSNTLNHIALKRIGNPEEVASVSLFLASQWSSYITGQIIKVDGGVHI